MPSNSYFTYGYDLIVRRLRFGTPLGFVGIMETCFGIHHCQCIKEYIILLSPAIDPPNFKRIAQVVE